MHLSIMIGVAGGFTDELHSQLLHDFPILQQDPLSQVLD